MNSIPVESGAELLSPDERYKLRQSVWSYLLAYSSGSFERYLEFRLPIASYHIYEEPLRKRYERLATNAVPAEPITNLDELARAYWKRSGGERPSWVGLDFDYASLEITAVSELGNLPHEMYPKRCPSNTVYTAMQLQSTYEIHPTPEQVLDRDGLLKSALVSCWVDGGDSGEPGPFFCRLYWDPKTQHWIPWRLAVGLAGSNRPGTSIF